MNDRLLRTIDTTYDCIGDNFDHDRALEAYSKAVDDTGLFFAEVGPEADGFKYYHYHNIPDDAVTALLSKYDNAATNNFFEVMDLIPLRTPILRRVFIPDEVHFATPMYQEASKPWGIHCEGSSILARDQMSTTFCNFGRHPDQEELNQDHLGIMAVLNNHYYRAIRLQGRLDVLEQTLIQSSNLLDLIDFGIVLYGKKADPVFVNAAAQRIIDQKDGVVLDARKLSFLDPEADKTFQDLVSALFRHDLPLSAKSGGVLKVPRVSGEKSYGAVLVPMPAQRDVSSGSATAAIFLFDPLANRTTAIDLFVTSHGLSRSEAELAHRLALGDSLDEAAAFRGISRNTAKGQLRSIFAKTNTSRQSELVSLLLRSIAGINLQARSH